MIRSGRIRSELTNNCRTLKPPRPCAGPIGLQVQAMLLAQPQFAGVFDHDDPLALGNGGAHRPQQRRLARAGATRDDDVLVQPHAQLQKFAAGLRQAAETDQVVERERLAGKLADCQIGATRGAGRNHGVDARAVGQPGVEHRPLRADLAADPLGNVMHGRQQCILAVEPGRRVFQPAATLDVNVLIAVDHDFGHGLIVEVIPDWIQEILDAGFENRFAWHGLLAAKSGRAAVPKGNSRLYLRC